MRTYNSIHKGKSCLHYQRKAT